MGGKLSATDKTWVHNYYFSSSLFSKQFWNGRVSLRRKLTIKLLTVSWYMALIGDAEKLAVSAFLEKNQKPSLGTLQSI